MARDINAGPLQSGFPHASTILIDPDTGQMTREGLRFWQLIWQRTGGGYDQVYDTAELAANVEQLSILSQNVTRLQQDVESLRNDDLDSQSLLARRIESQQRDLEALRAGIDQLDARKIRNPDIITNEVVNRALASRAATSTTFNANNSFGPYSMDRFADTVFSDFESAVVTKGTNDSPGRELLAVEATIQNANPGDPLLIIYDGQLNYRGGIAQFVCWHEKAWIMDAGSTFNNDYFGASAPRSTSDDDYLTTSDGARNMTRIFNRVQERPTEDLGSNISTEANNSNQILSIPITGMTVRSAPSDINTNSYKIVFAFVLDREQVSYQTGNNNGWKNASSTTDDWEIEDLDLFVINLKEKQ